MFEYVAVNIKEHNCKHFHRTGLVTEFGLSPDEVRQMERGGLILPGPQVEIIKKSWLRFVDSTKVAKVLYGHLLEGYDVLSVGELRSLVMLVAYVGTYDIPFPADYEKTKCFCVGHVDLYQSFEVQYYYVVGKTDG